MKHQKYPPFNPGAEARRLEFILKRDGLEVVLAYARALKRLYLNAALGTRKNTASRNHPYRYKYVEAAFSLRALQPQLPLVGARPSGDVTFRYTLK